VPKDTAHKATSNTAVFWVDIKMKARDKAVFWSIDFTTDGLIRKERTDAGRPVLIWA
jgi:hypothetical protein